jgi:hypothetical protein
MADVPSPSTKPARAKTAAEEAAAVAAVGSVVAAAAVDAGGSVVGAVAGDAGDTVVAAAAAVDASEGAATDTKPH